MSALPQDDRVLAFEAVTVMPDAHLGVGLKDISLTVHAGEILVIEVEEGREHVPLADAAEGLLLPDEGRVSFMGEDWASMSPQRQAEQRGRIRRVFRHYGWISNLDVLENICLAECHHTHRPEAEIVEEAEFLARRFGVNGIPDARPSRVHALVLRKLEWVRALLGRPSLMLLERPLFGAPKADAALLIGAVTEEAKRGTAVLWLTDDARVSECRQFERARRCRMDGDCLRDVISGGS